MSLPTRCLRPRPLVVSLAGLSLFTILLGPSPALAKKDGRAKLDKICAEIECSDKQAREVGQVFEQLHVDIKADRKAIKDLRKQLASEWAKDRPSETTLASLANKIGAHERNIADRKLEAMIELHPLLTQAQRERVAAHLVKGRK